MANYGAKYTREKMLAEIAKQPTQPVGQFAAGATAEDYGLQVGKPYVPKQDPLGFLGPLGKVIDAIDTPRAMLVSGLQETIDLFQGEGFSVSDWYEQTKDNYMVGNLLQNEGWGTDSDWDLLIGLPLDIAMDPVTYMGGPFGAGMSVARNTLGAVRVAAKMKNVAKTASKAAAVADKAGDATKAATEAAKANKYRDAAAAVVKNNAISAAPREVLEEMGFKAAGGISLTAPGTGRIGRKIIERPVDRVLGGLLSKILDPKRINQIPKFMIDDATFDLWGTSLKAQRNRDLVEEAMGLLKRGRNIDHLAHGQTLKNIRQAAKIANSMAVDTGIYIPGTYGIAMKAMLGPGRLWGTAMVRTPFMEDVHKAFTSNDKGAVKRMMRGTGLRSKELTTEDRLVGLEMWDGLQTAMTAERTFGVQFTERLVGLRNALDEINDGLREAGQAEITVEDMMRMGQVENAWHMTPEQRRINGLVHDDAPSVSRQLDNADPEDLTHFDSPEYIEELFERIARGDAVMPTRWEAQIRIKKFWEDVRTDFNKALEMDGQPGFNSIEEMLDDFYVARFLDMETEIAQKVANKDFWKAPADHRHMSGMRGSPTQPRTYKPGETFLGRVLVSPAQHPEGLSIVDQMRVIGKEIIGDDFVSMYSEDFWYVTERWGNVMGSRVRHQRWINELERAGVIQRGTYTAERGLRLSYDTQIVKDLENLVKTINKEYGKAKTAFTNSTNEIEAARRKAVAALGNQDEVQQQAGNILVRMNNQLTEIQTLLNEFEDVADVIGFSPKAKEYLLDLLDGKMALRSSKEAALEADILEEIVQFIEPLAQRLATLRKAQNQLRETFERLGAAGDQFEQVAALGNPEMLSQIQMFLGKLEAEITDLEKFVRYMTGNLHASAMADETVEMMETLVKLTDDINDPAFPLVISSRTTAPQVRPKRNISPERMRQLRQPRGVDDPQLVQRREGGKFAEGKEIKPRPGYEFKEVDEAPGLEKITIHQFSERGLPHQIIIEQVIDTSTEASRKARPPRPENPRHISGAGPKDAKKGGIFYHFSRESTLVPREGEGFGGLHVGTWDAAAQRGGKTSGTSVRPDGSGVIHTVEVKPKNPYMPKGKILDERVAKDRTELWMLRNSPERLAKLRAEGHDVIPYINTAEANGSLSYLILDNAAVNVTGESRRVWQYGDSVGASSTGDWYRNLTDMPPVRKGEPDLVWRVEHSGKTFRTRKEAMEHIYEELGYFKVPRVFRNDKGQFVSRTSVEDGNWVRRVSVPKDSPIRSTKQGVKWADLFERLGNLSNELNAAEILTTSELDDIVGRVANMRNSLEGSEVMLQLNEDLARLEAYISTVQDTRQWFVQLANRGTRRKWHPSKNAEGRSDYRIAKDRGWSDEDIALRYQTRQQARAKGAPKEAAREPQGTPIERFVATAKHGDINDAHRQFSKDRAAYYAEEGIEPPDLYVGARQEYEDLLKVKNQIEEQIHIQQSLIDDAVNKAAAARKELEDLLRPRVPTTQVDPSIPGASARYGIQGPPDYSVANQAIRAEELATPTGRQMTGEADRFAAEAADELIATGKLPPGVPRKSKQSDDLLQDFFLFAGEAQARKLQLQAEITRLRESGSLTDFFRTAPDPDEVITRVLADRGLYSIALDSYGEAQSNFLRSYRNIQQTLTPGEPQYVVGGLSDVGFQMFEEALRAGAKLHDFQQVGEFLTGYRKFANWWKSQAVTTPGFILRNLMGGMWINAAIAGVDFGTHSKVVGMAKTAALWGNGDVLKGMRMLAAHDKPVELAGIAGLGGLRKASNDDFKMMVELLESGSVGSGQAWSEVVSSADSLGKLNVRPRKVYERDVRQTRGGRTAIRSGLTQGFKEGRWAPWSADFKLSRAIRAQNERAEFVLRAAVGFDTLSKGGDIQRAYQLITKYHFDYSDVTNVERRIKDVIPFYTWQKNVIPVLIESIGRKPESWGRLLQVKRELELHSPREGLVPDYFGENMGIRMPFKVPGLNGGRVYALPDLPFRDFQRYLKEPTSPIRGPLESAFPWVKLPAEIWATKQTFADIPFMERYQQVPTWGKIPGIMEVLGMMGKAKKAKDGTWVMRDNDIYAVEQFIPFFSRMRRMFPNEKAKQRRLMTTWISTIFGGGFRVNDHHEKRSQFIRDQKKFANDMRDILDIETRRV